jgi:hypothetical protein
MKTLLMFALFLSFMALTVIGYDNSTRNALASISAPCIRGTFASSRDPIPVNWPGPVFRLSQDYPEAPPPTEPYPWKSIDFRTNPEAYLLAVRRYLYEGNLNPAAPNAPWNIQNNSVRKWYHAPWLDGGRNGREFIHGLTRELASVPGQLWRNPPQNATIQNWAVGFYNAPGGYVLGQVWCNPQNPTTSSVIFPEGTVSAKLLFSAAPNSQVPFLQGSVQWTANINKVATDPQSPRQPQFVRLLQIDLAVRDIRNTDTGWVFGTLIYDPNAAGQSPWDKMQPVGVMWGNDPGVTPNNGLPIKQTWLNPAVAPLMQHYGWAERLNGPVDNPLSSCLSCHSTAGWPIAPLVPPSGSSDQQRLPWFRNIKAGQPFSPGQASFDYSLQLAYGIRQFKAENPPAPILSAIGNSGPMREVNRSGTDEAAFRRDVLRELEKRRRLRRR